MYNEFFLHPLSILAIALHLAAIYFYVSRKERLGICLLVAGAFVARFWVAELDPYLNDWDEKFHALVGKNLSRHFFYPTLVNDPALPINYKEWTENYIWLHKQPLFLWQIAISIKLFGANTLAVRIPSVLLGTLMVFFTYSTAKILYSKSVGFIAALLVSTSFYPLMMISGAMGMDHNDHSYMFYILLSVFCWLKYEQTQRKIWLLAMGACSGLAILCKWLTGLFVFLLFAINHFFKNDLFKPLIAKHLSISMLACLAIAIPWQLYILHEFPIESRYEYYYNSRHFTEVIEGHAHHLAYHIDLIKEHYRMLQAFAFVGICLSILTAKMKQIKLSLTLGILFIYVFFTIASTKLSNYTLMVMPIVFLFLAYGIHVIISIFSKVLPIKSSYLSAMLLPLVCIQNLNLAGIESYHNCANEWWCSVKNAKTKNLESLKSIAGSLPSNTIIVWLNNRQNIDCMFHIGYTAYGDVSLETLTRLKLTGRPIAYFEREDLPLYIRNDSSLISIEKEVYHY